VSLEKDPPNRVEWRLFGDKAGMARQAAGDIQAIIRSAIEARGAAVIALPGGRTPVPIFEELADRNVDWPCVTLLPTDDRLVPVGDPLSNAGMIRAHFAGTGARLLTLFDEAAGIGDAGRSANEMLAKLCWPLDLVWLGMGEDGHVASILPGPDFESALNGPADRRACVVTPDPLPADAPVERVTLTRAALVAARSLMLTITGDGKRVVAEQAIRDGARSRFAVGRVLAAMREPVEIYWSR
jgi:6-phosphogluconolactonase